MTPNRDIAAVLGVHAVTISRLRSGRRRPSNELMARIESKLGWKLDSQMKAYLDPDRTKYAQELRKFLLANYNVADKRIKKTEQP